LALIIAQMNNQLLFVYGTLLIADNEIGSYMRSRCVYVCDGRIKGRLYNIGEYPGAVIDENAQSFVYGRIYRVNESSVFDMLDEYEGITPADPIPHEYRRELQVIETDAGTLNCWMYVYNWPTTGLSQINSGDYLSDRFSL
jgi:gamma-glutamylcyclotransferase (GGCT)/AIG2-like uncharacterized protein YtfP